ncbi:MAG: hypothetical protein E3J64_07435 [Anaerolineales bacterium]|nr:MAG: hypothetical protein E3J64_07435 [Anaerolineales bacterium]
MVLTKTEQKYGTDLVDAHNKANLDLIDAIMTQVDLLSEDTGHVAQACLFLATLPTDTNTVTIGADVYEFAGAGSNINVLKGVSAATARANLIAAINGQGTELVVADAPTTPATSVRIQPADRVGGTAQIGAGTSIAVSETLANASDVWNVANLNESGAPPYLKVARGKLVITAENLASLFTLELPFTPVVFAWSAFTTGGVPVGNKGQAVINGDYLEFDLDVTTLAATDYVIWEAYGN